MHPRARNMTASNVKSDSVRIERIETSVYRVPTDYPESDGTLEWDRTTLVLVRALAATDSGLGYTYADSATAAVVDGVLAKTLVGRDAMAMAECGMAMLNSIRNLGRPGIVSMAIAAVDSALWDLKARLLRVPLVKLLGAARESVPIYGSGGFTSYSVKQLQEQLAGWVERGIPRVKMKVGRDAEADVKRVRAAREAIGPDAELFVDANGAYSRKQALKQAEAFAEMDVKWFEEPVSSDDLSGLHLIRNRAPAGMEIAAGEYGYDPGYFHRMLEAEAVDVLQADPTRCGGITELLRVDGLCRARGIPLSLHCGPAIHLHPGLALQQLAHLEYFHDHVRIEHELFDGVPTPRKGSLFPHLDRPGTGLELKRADAERHAA